MNEMDGYMGLYEQRSSFAVSAASASGAGAAGSVAASYETYSATGDRVVVSWIARTQRPYLDLVVQAAAASAADGCGTAAAAAAAGVARIREVLDAGEHLAVVADTSCEPLEDVVAARREQGLRFSEEEMWGYLVQCLLALRALHARDVAHGCVSALRIDPVSGTVELGLPLLGRQPHAKYAPPELQAACGDGAGAATERGDVYELGCVMTELLHLRNAKTVELRPARTHVGVDACFLLRKMTEEAPEDRPTLAQVLEYHAVQARLGAAAADADAADAAAGAEEAQARLEAVVARERAVEEREAAVAAREARVQTFLSLYRLTARQLDAVPASPAQAQLFVDYYDLDEGAASGGSRRAADAGADADADADGPLAAVPGASASPVEASEHLESAASAHNGWAADVAAEYNGVQTIERRSAPHAGPSQPPSRELSFGEDETTASCADAASLGGGWPPRAAGNDAADEPPTGDGPSSLVGAAWSGASAPARSVVPRAGVVECEVVDSGGFCTDDTATTTPARPTPQPQQQQQHEEQEPPLQAQSWTANTTCSSAAQDGGGLSTPGGGLGHGGCDDGSQAAAGATPPPWTHEESIAWHLQRSPERLVSPGGRSRSTPLQQCRLDEAGHVVKPWQRRSIQASLQQNMAELEDLVQRNRAQSGSRRRTRDDLLSQRSHRRRLDLGDGAASRSESMPSPAPSSPPPPSEPASQPVSLSSPAPEQRGRRRSGSGVSAAESSTPPPQPPTPSSLPEGKRRQRPSPSPRRIQLVGGPVTRARSYREGGGGGGEGAGEPHAAAASSGRRRVPAAASHTAPNVVAPARAQQGAPRAAAAAAAARLAAVAGGGDPEESPQDLLRRLRAERCSLMRQTSTA